MQRYSLTLEAKSPLHFAVAPGAGGAERDATLDYIPGSAVRGAVAARLMGEPGSQDDFFRWVFLSGEVRFGNLYAEAPGQASGRVFVLPQSAVTCKLYQGFERPDPNQQHGCWDMLLLAGAERLEVLSQLACGGHLGGDADCPCEAPLDPYRGYLYVRGASAWRPSLYEGVAPQRSDRARTAIRGTYRTAASGQLFTVEVLDPGRRGVPARFSGQVTVTGGDKSDVDRLQTLLSNSQGGLQTLTVGADISQGCGHVGIREGIGALDDGLPPLGKRLSDLDDTYHANPINDPAPHVFAVTLQSDALLRDELWRDRACLQPGDLGLGQDVATGLLAAFTGTRTVWGWDAAKRLPRAPEVAIRKGSCFLFSTSVAPAGLEAGLRRLELEGIGRRRAEGFGEVIISHPFHLEVPKDAR